MTLATKKQQQNRPDRTKKAADLVWLLMKPLEWLFLLVLYLFDATPENRIAVQYMPVRQAAPRQPR